MNFFLNPLTQLLFLLSKECAPLKSKSSICVLIPQSTKKRTTCKQCSTTYTVVFTAQRKNVYEQLSIMNYRLCSFSFSMCMSLSLSIWFCLSALCVSLFYTHTGAHTHTHANAHTRTHTPYSLMAQ